MAISKIWPLYQTIGKAVKYICNYEKTEDGTLITSYKCTERFADHEFHDIEAKARKVKKPRIGYAIIGKFKKIFLYILGKRRYSNGKINFSKYSSNSTFIW